MNSCFDACIFDWNKQRKRHPLLKRTRFCRSVNKNVTQEWMVKGEEQRVTECPTRICWHANDDR
jgi:hypothetical protein